MSIHGPGRLVERAAKRFDLNQKAEHGSTLPGPSCVITISRQLGSGGRRIAEALSEQLGCRLWDKEILDVLVGQAHLGYPPRMYDLVDEGTQSAVDAFAHSLMGDVNKFLYMHLLPKAFAVIAEQDAVILGRGAHLVLPKALKIRVVASADSRLNNLMKHDGVSRQVAQDQIRNSDRTREAFLRDFARHLRVKFPENGRESQYDLVLNTDRLSIEDGVRVIRMLVDLRFGKAAARQRKTPAQQEGHVAA